MTAGVFRGVRGDVVSDSLVVFAVGLGCHRPQDADCQRGVTGGCIGGAIELVVADDVLVEPPLGA